MKEKFAYSCTVVAMAVCIWTAIVKPLFDGKNLVPAVPLFDLFYD